MKNLKSVKIIAVISALLSVILYSVVFVQPISLIEFQSALFSLYFAEAFLFLTVILLVCLVICDKMSINFDKIKKFLMVSSVIIMVGCIVLCGCAYIDCYNAYTPENKFSADGEYMQKFYPYHDIKNYSRERKDPIDLSVSHIPGTDYVYIYCFGEHFSDINYDYELEYIKSISPFMNVKFLAERAVPTAFNELELDVVAKGNKIEIDGVNVTVYVENNNYAVLISSFGESVYASLIDAPENITVEDFAREVIKQSDLLKEATKDRAFLDVPISEIFS